MPNPILWLFDTSGFGPRWHCGHWFAELGWLHIASDALIWLACLTIPAVLLFFIRRRRDMPFPRIIWLFGGFILASGTTHLIQAIVFWYPLYRLAGVIKFVTAIVSWLTVIALVPIIPKVLAMRTPAELESEVKTRTSELLQASMSLHREVQERLKAEREVREQRKLSEDSLRLRDRVISAANQGISITDAQLPDNLVIYASPGFERITGYAADEIIGQNCRFLQGPETDPQTIARVREAVQAGEPCTVEILNYRKDGTSFWNELSISPVRDEANRLTHFVGVQADVTARRAMSEQLRQAQKMESVGRLAGGVAHDFNNMLTIINGCSDLVLSGMASDDPSYDLLKEVKTAGERAEGLTRQLLAFSRQQLIVTQVVDFNEVVVRTQNMLQRLIGEDVELSINLQPELPAVRADRGQLEQILLNLAVNARDAMPQGGELTIETGSVLKTELDVNHQMNSVFSEYVALKVSDTGCGFDPKLADRLFEPFFTTKGIGDGTGLGLAVVHGIVTQAGGFVDVRTEENKGSQFRIFLPAVTEDTPAAAAQDEQQPAELHRGTERVLLVEDEPGLRTFARKVLFDCGYHVLDAANGKNAIQLAMRRNESIDLLVTDVVMPGIGGREVAAEVRKMYPSAAILFMSGYTDDAIVRNGIFQDEVEFLQKPFSPTALSHKVRQLLDEKKRSACAGNES
jgi:two-component system cell cycle sensor histidine kinase/response regulator CckA